MGEPHGRALEQIVLPARSADLRDTLRRDTEAVHAGLEEQLDLLNPTLSLTRYKAILRAFLGFYEPLETALKPLLPAAPPLGFAPPNKTPLLVRDLHYLGLSPGEIRELPRCDYTPRISRIEHLAGAVYVLEGASLGAKVVARALDKNLNLQSDTGAAFFSQGACGSSTRWKQTLRWLRQLSLSKNICVNELVGSARSVFTGLSRWTGSDGLIDE